MFKAYLLLVWAGYAISTTGYFPSDAPFIKQLAWVKSQVIHIQTATLIQVSDIGRGYANSL
ncbi:hypothetical protein CIT292_07005 [Citrobacter youngae ATCC 29220]|uniref:Uncharacterized protein n=1 Tax=Citrobacter youngae ATCC 29220 TaxID=500640 RepID=D4B965_9ENTR|nr:hypothetical protein CIT292_07005 [Citrobacter youngae ATCC 29220]